MNIWKRAALLENAILALLLCGGLHAWKLFLPVLLLLVIWAYMKPSSHRMAASVGWAVVVGVILFKVLQLIFVLLIVGVAFLLIYRYRRKKG
ncbi:hypothetical protein [Bacillus sp. 1P06AnD]|uniref:hypothetical protein n=1 Tax=Bacillus sp. 1P06AnD TaxID=3132208 RepID=UPI0039A0B70E